MAIIAPDQILNDSFRIIDSEVGEHPFGPLVWPVVRRMIHACGDLDLVRIIQCDKAAVTAGVQAFRAGVPIIADVRMVATGIQAPAREALRIDLHCFLSERQIEGEAAAGGKTRCACAMEWAIARFPEAVYVVGSAPTALAALAGAVRRGVARPRLVVATPVGFVGVLESKEEALALPVPVIAVRGRRGGSAVAAAAVNALLLLALEGAPP